MFIGWVAYHEDIPLIRHDVTGWEPIVDQAAARAVPLEQVRLAGPPTMVVGTVKAPRRPAVPRAVGCASRSWWSAADVGGPD